MASDFDIWWAQLLAEAADMNWPMKGACQDDYRDYYDDGYSPRDTILEEASYD